MVPTEDKAQGSVSTKTYYHYFIAGGSYIGVLILLFFFVMTEVSLQEFVCVCVCVCVRVHTQVLGSMFDVVYSLQFTLCPSVLICCRLTF